jgi:outer membrane protein insertion porin family
MRRWLAQPVLLGVICLLTPQPTHAQQTRLCPRSASNSDQRGPDISVAEVAFSGALQMPVADRDQIEASLRQRTFSGSLDGVADEAEERVRAAWQNRGYFKVQVSGDAKILTSSPGSQRIALSFRLDEGLQYRLGQIRFLNNKAISDAGTLRALFPITDGAVFSREEIAKGLENLRKAYGEIGYINFTSVPDTRFDDEEGLIYLHIDIDEGKQFRLGGISFPGLDETSQYEALQDFPLQPGKFITRESGNYSCRDTTHCSIRAVASAGSTKEPARSQLV